MTNTSNVALQPHRLILLLFLLLAILGASVAFAQPSSDGRTVIKQRDIPFVITRPGSYVLGSNLIVRNLNVNAIVVNADNVTIDLAGFAIIGPNVGPTDRGSAITNGRTVRVTVVRNGTVRGFFDPLGSCVSLGDTSIVEDLRVEDCGSAIFVGAGGIVRGCQVSNSAVGIGTYEGSLIMNNTLYGNSNNGVSLNLGGNTLIGNTFRKNGAAIHTGPGGIGNRIEGNTLTNNFAGFWFEGSGNFFARNVLQGNTIVGDTSGNIDGGTIDPALTNVVIP